MRALPQQPALPRNPFQRRVALVNRYGRSFIGARRNGMLPPERSHLSVGSKLFNPILHSDDFVQEVAQEWQALQTKGHSSPLNVLITGRRGEGKTVTLTFMLEWWAARLAEIEFAPGIHQRVITNYHVEGVANAGPLARVAPTADIAGGVEVSRSDETDEEWEAQLEEVLPCHIDNPMRMAKEWPEWGYNSKLGIDEVADITNHLRAGGTEARQMSGFMRQQRHMGIEMYAATQFIHQIPKSTVALQFDLFVRLNSNFKRPGEEGFYWDPEKKAHGIVVMRFYDFFSNIWNCEKKYNGRYLDWTMPCDWETEITGISSMFGRYDTTQIVPPSWVDKAQKARMLAGHAAYQERVERAFIARRQGIQDRQIAFTTEDREEARNG